MEGQQSNARILARLELWSHFDKIKVNGEDKAKCRFCNKILGANSKNGTHQLHHHLKICPLRTR